MTPVRERFIITLDLSEPLSNDNLARLRANVEDALEERRQANALNLHLDCITVNWVEVAIADD